MSGKRILVVLCLVVLVFVGLSTHVYAKTSEHTANSKNSTCAIVFFLKK